MDVNRTKFHLLLGGADWRDAELDQLEYDSAQDALKLRAKLFVFPPRPDEPPLAIADRRGSGVDRYGNVYWIAQNGTEIRFLPRGSRRAQPFWPPEPAACCAPAQGTFVEVAPRLRTTRALSGIAVTEQHYLVVGASGPAAVLIFDLHGGGAPQEIAWPVDVPFAPFDMAARKGGGAWILDHRNTRYWGLSDTFEILNLDGAAPHAAAAPDFAPKAGSQENTQVRLSGISNALAAPVGTADAVAIEDAGDGSVLVLERGTAFSTVHRFQGAARIGTFALDDALEGLLEDPAAPTAVSGHDFTFSAESGRLFLVEAAGNQSFAFHFVDQGGSFELQLEPRYFPMREFGGKALVTGMEGPLYDSGDLWLPLVEQPRRRYEMSGTSVIQSAAAGFDGKLPGCVWHRLFFDACVPAGTSVEVETRAADTADDLLAQPWSAEPPPRNRSLPEIPWTRNAPGRSTFETLLQRARGRLLQVRLTLTGSGRATPEVTAVRVYYPRFSYLERYLPGIYREDPVSAFFLERYLANPEGMATEIEGRIENVQSLFDARTVPPEYLEWLAGWMGATLDPSWDVMRQRLFVKHAMQMFEQRGTAPGVVLALRLALDTCPDESLFSSNGADAPARAAGFAIRLVERFRTRTAPGVTLGDPSDVLGPGSTTSSSAWVPAQGSGPLHQRFREYLASRYPAVEQLNDAWKLYGADRYDSFADSRIVLAAVRPADETAAADWDTFVRGDIGFRYAPPADSDEPLYRQFLARRYRQPVDLNRAYGLRGTASLNDWSELPSKLWESRLRVSLPAGGPMLQDWIQFVSFVLPANRDAHRFTVLIPVQLTDPPDEQQRRLELARRITELEKPAHTAFDMKLYFALFRVGEARLGLDTTLGTPSRMAAIILGQQALASGYLSYVPPWDVTGRLVAGRDELDRY